MRRLWYYTKAQGGWLWLALTLLVALLVLILLNDGFRPSRLAPRALADVAGVTELWLPLVAALLVAGLPALEREHGVAELALSYRQPAWIRLLEQLTLPVLLWSILLQAVGLVAHQWYVELDGQEFLRMALPPAAGLAGAALAGTALSRHQVGGVVTAGLWWGIDLIAPVRFNTWAYLFTTYQPRSVVDTELMHRNLWLVGGACLLLALWLAERRERWVSP